ncbi:MAG: hypothetical protein PHH83_02940 [Patescibacteria group bacterium]|nr:hypothetical protein [Patescibacteria group bacterium]
MENKQITLSSEFASKFEDFNDFEDASGIDTLKILGDISREESDYYKDL